MYQVCYVLQGLCEPCKVYYGVGLSLYVCYVCMCWLADESVSPMRWDEEDSKGGWRYVRDMYGRISMGMDGRVRRLKWVVTWRFYCVGHESMELKNIGIEVIWIMFGYDKSIYAMSCGRMLHGCFAGVHATEHSSQVISMHVQRPVRHYCCSVPWYSRQINMHVCIRDVCSSGRFMQNCYWYNSDAYWGYRTLHSFPSPVSHTCVYMFLFVFSRQY